MPNLYGISPFFRNSSVALLLAFAFFWGLSVISYAHAATRLSDVYTVEAIQIDESADTEVGAKDLGIAKAKVAGLKQLVNRLATDISGLDLSAFRGATIDKMIRDITIVNERFGGGRYLAELTVRFQPQAIRDILDRQGIAYSENATDPLIVVPILDTNGRRLLWDFDNEWQKAWGRIAIPQGLLPVHVPLGDLDDVYAITVDQALNLDPSGLDAIRERHGGSGVLIAYVQWKIDAISQKHDIRSQIFVQARGWQEKKSFSPLNGDDPNQLMENLASMIVRDLQMSWKSKTQFARSQGASELFVTLPVTRLADWIEMNRLLSDMPIIKQKDILRISVSEVDLKLDYAGREDQLKLALSQAGLSLVFDEEHEKWLIVKAN